MDREQVITDILTVVDLEEGKIDSAGLAKKYNKRAGDMERFLVANGIALPTFGPLRLIGELLEEARQERGYYKKK